MPAFASHPLQRFKRALWRAGFVDAAVLFVSLFLILGSITPIRGDKSQPIDRLCTIRNLGRMESNASVRNRPKYVAHDSMHPEQVHPLHIQEPCLLHKFRPALEPCSGGHVPLHVRVCPACRAQTFVNARGRRNRHVQTIERFDDSNRGFRRFINMIGRPPKQALGDDWRKTGFLSMNNFGSSEIRRCNSLQQCFR